MSGLTGLEEELNLKFEAESNRRLQSLDWTQLVAFCPELEDLRLRFHKWAQNNTDPNLDTMQWSRWIKPEMREMVGWYSTRWTRDHPMTSHQAWNIAHREIFLSAPMGWKKTS
jgi:hypothetical protein